MHFTKYSPRKNLCPFILLPKYHDSHIGPSPNNRELIVWHLRKTYNIGMNINYLLSIKTRLTKNDRIMSLHA